MFLFSKEEPITNNESLYQRKGNTDELISDQSAGLLINRYGLVYKGSEMDKEISLIVKAFINHLGIKVFAVLCWLVQIAGKSKVAAKVIEKRYEKKNWSIYSRGNHYMAIKAISSGDINAWPPLGISPLDGGIILLIGNFDEIDILDLISDDNSIFLAKNKYFAPNVGFLSNLEREKVSAIYQMNDEINNIGLVFVGKLTVDIAAISKDVSNIKIFEGESAYKIFI